MTALHRPAAGLLDRAALAVSTILRTSTSTTVRPSILQSYAAPLAAVGGISLRLPNLLGDIWESILRAVPKKKTSHMKKRQRFLVGKGLKNEIALNKCPSCGTVKRAHMLCPWCVKEIQDMWKGKDAQTAEETK